MDWNQLKEEAKKLGYSDYYNQHINAIEKNGFMFYKDGWILYIGKKDGNEVLLSSERTYDQMLAIMKALQ